ncbi:MAG: 16S rRNA (adenine(1518)-N(6)/adenine(1519)-N(6))-dimethyltransferase RsmA [Blastocatellia bacterium]
MIKANKSLGQNFLTDGGVARRIIGEVSPLPNDIVIEIGPGTGALTGMLVKQSGYVVAVEIDDRLVEGLRRSLKAENLTVINADALGLDWTELISDAKTKLYSHRSGDTYSIRVRIVANLPYYISTPLIERLLSIRGQLFDMTLMLQKEVAARITTRPGNKDYGYLSVMVQYYCEATKLFDVPASAFTPVPKVESSVIRLTVHVRPPVEIEDETQLFAVVRASFAQRRKTILNNLKAAAGVLNVTGSLEPALGAALIDPRRRAETLSLEEFVRLCKALKRG